MRSPIFVLFVALIRSSNAAPFQLRALSSSGDLPPEDQGIIGGSDIDRIPDWIATLGNFTCMGTLIHRDVIMTSASCVSGGVPEFVTLVPTSLTRKRKVLVDRTDGAYIHPCFSSSTLLSDVALLKLAELVPDKRSNMNPDDPASGYETVTLNEDEDVPEGNGATLAVLGYGTTSVSEPQTPSKNLKEGFVEYINTCTSNYPSYSADEQLCALGGDGQTGVCDGDMGGPLLT